MAITNKAMTIQIDRELRIIVDAIERGDAEFTGRAARILFQTVARRYRSFRPARSNQMLSKGVVPERGTNG